MGLSQAALADRLSVSTQTIKWLERGVGSVTTLVEAMSALTRLGLLYRQGRSSEALPRLREVPEDASGSPSDLMTLARLIDQQLPGDVRAASLGYRALRAGYADPDVHLAYAMGLFLNGGVGHVAPPPTKVEPGTGIVLRNERTGALVHRVIETAEDAAPERGELPLRGALARRLMDCD